jgi:hypothetical protein
MTAAQCAGLEIAQSDALCHRPGGVGPGARGGCFADQDSEPLAAVGAQPAGSGMQRVAEADEVEDLAPANSYQQERRRTQPTQRTDGQLLEHLSPEAAAPNGLGDGALQHAVEIGDCGGELRLALEEWDHN